MRKHHARQASQRLKAGEAWQDDGLVLSSTSGRPLDVANVRRAFRLITKKAGTGETWSPRELRHSFVSATSDGGLRIEAIADLCGHFSPAVSGEVYRQPPIGRSRPRRPGPLSHAAGPVAVRAVVAPVLADLDEHGFPVGEVVGRPRTALAVVGWILEVIADDGLGLERIVPFEVRLDSPAVGQVVAHSDLLVRGVSRKIRIEEHRAAVRFRVQPADVLRVRGGRRRCRSENQSRRGRRQAQWARESRYRSHAEISDPVTSATTDVTGSHAIEQDRHVSTAARQGHWPELEDHGHHVVSLPGPVEPHLEEVAEVLPGSLFGERLVVLGDAVAVLPVRRPPSGQAQSRPPHRRRPWPHPPARKVAAGGRLRAGATQIGQ
ncbi:tyrosine-type recombinase/integrase [Actinomadura nitritigenes]|uniref:Tyrosine-type recombinase/integrase n=1 Tax=Actinomadura nitritigenes TaxID=134602 RepID=A0ABS3RE26_9ACTN|nr:tyrosine-type recombinase/integrase [Actinomadura nitritigenes]